MESFRRKIFLEQVTCLTVLLRIKRDQAPQQPSHARCAEQYFGDNSIHGPGASSYHALLANVRANLTPNLYALVSYTLGHSIDTGSSDTLPVLIKGPSNSGSSSFDVRQVLCASFGYRTPGRFGHVLGGWILSSTSFARTGFPFDVTTVDQSIGLGFDNSDRANLVPGQPIWIYNSSLPGGRALKSRRFSDALCGIDWCSWPQHADRFRSLPNRRESPQADASLPRKFSRGRSVCLQPAESSVVR